MLLCRILLIVWAKFLLVPKEADASSLKFWTLLAIIALVDSKDDLAEFFMEVYNFLISIFDGTGTSQWLDKTEMGTSPFCRLNCVFTRPLQICFDTPPNRFGIYSEEDVHYSGIK
uniref:Uncharacterized protein n=1 Tax=Lepeophtheirus salmonis TaxID=72036 RepID=A0A0K2UC68_LEPSM